MGRSRPSRRRAEGPEELGTMTKKSDKIAVRSLTDLSAGARVRLPCSRHGEGRGRCERARARVPSAATSSRESGTWGERPVLRGRPLAFSSTVRRLGRQPAALGVDLTPRDDRTRGVTPDLASGGIVERRRRAPRPSFESRPRSTRGGRFGSSVGGRRGGKGPSRSCSCSRALRLSSSSNETCRAPAPGPCSLPLSAIPAGARRGGPEAASLRGAGSRRP